MLPLLILVAVNAGTVWVYLGPVLAGLGAVAAGSAGIWAQKNKSKTDKVDYHNSLLVAMQTHLNSLSTENESLRNRVDSLSSQVQRCQNDKYEMQQQLVAWERKWEEKLRGSTPA